MTFAQMTRAQIARTGTDLASVHNVDRQTVIRYILEQNILSSIPVTGRLQILQMNSRTRVLLGYLRAKCPTL